MLKMKVELTYPFTLEENNLVTGYRGIETETDSSVCTVYSKEQCLCTVMYSTTPHTAVDSTTPHTAVDSTTPATHCWGQHHTTHCCGQHHTTHCCGQHHTTHCCGQHHTTHCCGQHHTTHCCGQHHTTHFNYCNIHEYLLITLHHIYVLLICIRMFAHITVT